MGVADAPQDQGPDPERIAHADQGLAGHGDQGIGAFHLSEGVDQALDDARAMAGGEKVDDDFGVGSGLKDAAAPHQAAAGGVGVG